MFTKLVERIRHAILEEGGIAPLLSAELSPNNDIHILPLDGYTHSSFTRMGRSLGLEWPESQLFSLILVASVRVETSRLPAVLIEEWTLSKQASFALMSYRARKGVIQDLDAPQYYRAQPPSPYLKAFARGYASRTLTDTEADALLSWAKKKAR